MASNRRSTKRPNRPAQSRPTSQNGPRRLGSQQQASQRSASAQRRYERARRTRRTTNWRAWAGVAVVVAVVLAFSLYKLTTHSPGSKNGHNRTLAPASVVSELASIPASTFNAVGTEDSTDPFTETAKQPFLRFDGKPQFLYVGAEYCPYCAMYRWSLVTALSKFGTFKNLHETSSNADVAPIPTFSFFGSSYSSPYISFTPYETQDRNGNTLENPPSYVADLFRKYDGTSSTASKFNAAHSEGIPFVDVANQHVSSGAPIVLNDAIDYVAGGGPGGFNGIAYAIAHATSSAGKEIKAAGWIAAANYDMAAICNVDGGKPGSVCHMAGVKAAQRVMAASKKVS
jgi:thiol-disulfide isomerase/thioredoxin